MGNIKILRKGIFPLRTLNININNNNYKMKGNSEIIVSIPSKEFDINMTMDWWKSTKSIKLRNEQNKIEIKHKFPDIFFILGLFFLSIITILTFIGILPINVITIYILIYVLIQAYYVIFKSSEYFNINVS